MIFENTAFKYLKYQIQISKKTPFLGFALSFSIRPELQPSEDWGLLPSDACFMERP